MKKHTDKIATSILRGEYADYDKYWWHYDREYNMLLKVQTEAFKLANEAAEQQDKEAIDTVLLHINTGNNTALDDSLQEKSIEQPDNQEGLSNKKDRLYTAKDMEDFAECMSFKEYSYHPKAKMWTYGMANRKTTEQLRELWEQERGEE